MPSSKHFILIFALRITNIKCQLLDSDQSESSYIDLNRINASKSSSKLLKTTICENSSSDILSFCDLALLVQDSNHFVAPLTKFPNAKTGCRTDFRVLLRPQKRRNLDLRRIENASKILSNRNYLYVHEKPIYSYQRQQVLFCEISDNYFFVISHGLKENCLFFYLPNAEGAKLLLQAHACLRVDSKDAKRKLQGDENGRDILSKFSHYERLLFAKKSEENGNCSGVVNSKSETASIVSDTSSQCSRKSADNISVNKKKFPKQRRVRNDDKKLPEKTLVRADSIKLLLGSDGERENNESKMGSSPINSHLDDLDEEISKLARNSAVYYDPVDEYREIMNFDVGDSSEGDFKKGKSTVEEFSVTNNDISYPRSSSKHFEKGESSEKLKRINEFVADLTKLAERTNINDNEVNNFQESAFGNKLIGENDNKVKSKSSVFCDENSSSVSGNNAILSEPDKTLSRSSGRSKISDPKSRDKNNRNEASPPIKITNIDGNSKKNLDELAFVDKVMIENENIISKYFDDEDNNRLSLSKKIAILSDKLAKTSSDSSDELKISKIRDKNNVNELSRPNETTNIENNTGKNLDKFAFVDKLIKENSTSNSSTFDDKDNIRFSISAKNAITNKLEKTSSGSSESSKTSNAKSQKASDNAKNKMIDKSEYTISGTSEKSDISTTSYQDKLEVPKSHSSFQTPDYEKIGNADLTSAMPKKSSTEKAISDKSRNPDAKCHDDDLCQKKEHSVSAISDKLRSSSSGDSNPKISDVKKSDIDYDSKNVITNKSGKSEPETSSKSTLGNELKSKNNFDERKITSEKNGKLERCASANSSKATSSEINEASPLLEQVSSNEANNKTHFGDGSASDCKIDSQCENILGEKQNNRKGKKIKKTFPIIMRKILMPIL